MADRRSRIFFLSVLLLLLFNLNEGGARRGSLRRNLEGDGGRDATTNSTYEGREGKCEKEKST